MPADHKSNSRHRLEATARQDKGAAFEPWRPVRVFLSPFGSLLFWPAARPCAALFGITFPFPRVAVTASRARRGGRAGAPSIFSHGVCCRRSKRRSAAGGEKKEIRGGWPKRNLP